MGALDLLGSLVPRLNPVPRLNALVGPILRLRPRMIADEPQRHRFAKGFSGSVDLGWGAVTVVMGAALVGRVLAVAALAVLDISSGFCPRMLHISPDVSRGILW